MTNFGVVQGRLVQSPKGSLQWFPQEFWESEFFIASALGYKYIELIAERQYNAKNPLWSDEGIELIKDLTDRNGLSLYSFCDDHIIDHSILKDQGVVDQTKRLLQRGRGLGIKKLVLPLFEESELNEQNFQEFMGPIREIADAAADNSIVVCLETILNGPDLLSFLELLDHANVKCVFDTGNRIAFGHDIYDDIRVLGGHIAHVHIKDKNERNENVLLGTGKVNFKKTFEALSAVDYTGPYTFETYRGKDPLKTAEYNKFFIEFFIQEVSKNDEN
ncbi:MAG: sugar phosphate isomerase/epimerase [Bacteroidia bacterium]|nr:sugar phosphate isomerase/epimerase [Bacteroidia bacterium]